MDEKFFENSKEVQRKAIEKAMKSEFGLYLSRNPRTVPDDEFVEVCVEEICYIVNRILPILEKYEDRPRAFEVLTSHRFWSIIATFASALIPVAALFMNSDFARNGGENNTFWVLLVIAILGSFGTALNSFLSSTTQQHDYAARQGQAMQLRSFLHIHYANKGKHRYFEDLVHQCENIINRDVVIRE